MLARLPLRAGQHSLQPAFPSQNAKTSGFLLGQSHATQTTQIILLATSAAKQTITSLEAEQRGTTSPKNLQSVQGRQESNNSC